MRIMPKLQQFLIFLLFMLMSLLLPLNVKAQGSLTAEDEIMEATVISIQKQGMVQDEMGEHFYQELRLQVTKGSQEGHTIIVENGAIAATNIQKYKIGDRVLVTASKDFSGNDVFFITDYVRRTPLVGLTILFVICTVIVGGIWGVTSLVGMGFSFLVIFLFILPQLLNGHDPILIAVLGSTAIIPVTFYLSHGFNIKTHVAIVGTLFTLIFIGILANVFVNLTHLSGFTSDEASFLESEITTKIDVRGLLLAGIIISSLGILDDITISQSSVIKELREANKRLSRTELFTRGMRVGRDHIASLVNTLVLVYAGASLPLLLLFVNNPHPFSEVINYEMIAEEIVKTLVGSTGLILAVPITTALAVFYFARNSRS